MIIRKYPVGVCVAVGGIALLARYNVFTSVGACASVAICALLLIVGWACPIQTMRE